MIDEIKFYKEKIKKKDENCADASVIQNKKHCYYTNDF